MLRQEIYSCDLKNLSDWIKTKTLTQTISAAVANFL